MSHYDVFEILSALSALATVADFVLSWWPRHHEEKEENVPTDDEGK